MTDLPQRLRDNGAAICIEAANELDFRANLIRNACEEWASDDTQIKSLAAEVLPAGFDQGDDFVDMVMVTKMLVEEIKRLRA